MTMKTMEMKDKKKKKRKMGKWEKGKEKDEAKEEEEEANRSASCSRRPKPATTPKSTPGNLCHSSSGLDCSDEITSLDNPRGQRVSYMKAAQN